jgi:amino acid adenylation domain-containing protein
VSIVTPHLPPLSLDLSAAERFRLVAAAVPDQLAVVDDDRRITYAPLDAWSDQIAGAVYDHQDDCVAPVAVLCAHGPAVLAAMFGVLKAGRIYCVVDPAMPEARLAHILADLAADLVLADHNHLALAHRLSRADVRVLEIEALAAASFPCNKPPLPTVDDLAAIYYSSGTTGNPKGIVRDHAGLVHRAWVDTQVVTLCPGDAVAWLYPAAYPASISDIFGALLNGAALHVYRLHEQGIDDLVHWLDNQQIASLHLHVDVLRQVLAAVPDDYIFRHLRYVRPSDRVAIDDLRRLRCHLLPGVVVAHSLGSSEVGSVTRLVYGDDRPLEGEIAPVGFPLSTVEITLLDEAGQPVIGEGVGEIMVRSRYLARGYWNQPDLTTQRFQTDPIDPRCRIYRMGDLARRRPDGMLELVGRSDRRVKIRGFTVDLEAIEAALIRLPGVREAVVVTRVAAHDTMLVAYLCLDKAAVERSVSALRAALAQVLPAYMLPARFVFLEALPRHASGKVDRASLPPSGRERPDLAAPFVAPRSELEQQIAGIWAELLELDEVGVEDDFFELGGDSILAMRMVLAAEQATGGHIPPGYFRRPTIAALAELCTVATEPDPTQLSDAAGSARWAGPALVQRRQPRRRLPGAVSLIRWMIRKQLLRLGYWEGIAWLNFFGQPPLADRLFRTEQRQLQRLAFELGGQTAIEDSVMQASIIGNAIRGVFRASNLRQNTENGDAIVAMQQAPEKFWRDIAAVVAAGGERSGRRLYQLDGLEHLLHAHRQGRGIILLTYHNTGSVLTSGILAHLTNLGRVPTISLERALTIAEQDEGEDDAEVGQVASHWAAAHSLQAQRILRAGGIVRISNDMNYGGANSISRTIGQRRFRLKPGFADLALTSGAAIVPAYSYIDHTGCVYLKALPALSMLATPASRTAQVHHLLDLYVDFLETAWRAHPESLGWGLLTRYHRCPLVDSRGGERSNL